VVAGALAVVWVALVPTLQRRLVGGRTSLLAASARQLEEQGRARPMNQQFVDAAVRTADASRVVYLRPVGGGHGTTLRAAYDSGRTRHALAFAADRVARRAAATRSLQHGEVVRAGSRFAEVAVPDRAGGVLLFTASLHGTLENVRLVRSRLLWAGLIALGLAALVGWAAASAFGRRIRHLERAVGAIGSGDFAQPVVDRGADELGELARAFERMRLQLAQLDDARRAFIANASHELRTPIFSLGGFLELLADEDLDEATRREFLAVMAEQVERLRKLAIDLLDLSRLDAGAVQLEPEAVPLDRLATELGDEFAALAAQQGRELEVSTGDARLVLATRDRVLQIGRALVDNALLHTPDGTRVRIVARGATLAVEDDGPGIPADDHERVFVRFTRLERSRSTGTGLGLAIARELAELMGGRLWLQSAPGRTRFVLDLPEPPSEADAPVGRPSPASALTPT
jgi:signal transduction histidine kinase